MIGKTQFLTVLGILVLCGSALAVDGNEPVAHWKFDETSGTTALDCVGDNNGTVHGAIWTTGRIDGALSFDGVDDYVEVPDDESLDFGTGSFSIAAWIKVGGSTSDSLHTIAGKRKPTGNKNQFQFCVRDDSEVLWFYTYDGSSSDVTGVATISDGNWYHVAVVRDSNGTVELYVNGVLDKSTSLPVRNVDSDAFLAIGTHSTQRRNYFNGLIDDVRICDRALSAEEIRQIYLEEFSSYERAIIQIEDAIAEKEEMLDVIGWMLEEERDAYTALEELLESGDYGDLDRRDIAAAQREIESAIRHEGRAMNVLEKSIEKLKDSLSALSYEAEPNEGYE